LALARPRRTIEFPDAGLLPHNSQTFDMDEHS
jgi:hypothetical protein